MTMVNNFFVRNINGKRDLFKVVSSGSRYCATSRTILKPMVLVQGEWVVNDNAVPTIVVFGKLKGFTAHVSDKEIMDIVMSEASNLTKAEIDRDFKEMRNYFDTPNSAEVETWHRSGETIMSACLWTPFEAIPTEWF